MKGKQGQSRAGDRGVWLTWESGQGVTGWRAECVLRRYGVPTLGRRGVHAPGEHFGLKVPDSQARFAEYLLCRLGVALSSSLLNPRHANVTPGPMPPEWGKHARPVGLMGWFMHIASMLYSGDAARGIPQRSSKRGRAA